MAYDADGNWVWSDDYSNEGTVGSAASSGSSAETAGGQDSSSGSSWWDNLWSSLTPSVGGSGDDSATDVAGYWTGSRSERDARANNALAQAGETGGISDMLKKVLSFGQENKANPLLQMALMGVANAQKNEAAREAAETHNRYAAEGRNHNAQIARDVIAANSASVTGIKPTTGIVQGALKRLDGSQVFKNGKQVIQR